MDSNSNHPDLDGDAAWCPPSIHRFVAQIPIGDTATGRLAPLGLTPVSRSIFGGSIMSVMDRSRLFGAR